MSAMVGSQRSGGLGAVPVNIMAEIARDPDKFEERVGAYLKARDEARDEQAKVRADAEAVAFDRQSLQDERVGWLSKLEAAKADVEQREKAVAAREVKVTAGEKALATAKASLDQQRREHANGKAEFERMRARQLADLSQRDASAAKREADLDARRTAIAEAHTELQAQQAALRRVDGVLRTYLGEG